MISPYHQGYLDVMRLDRKGQGKPCGRGFISAQKKCSKEKAGQLASDLKAGDAAARARVKRGAELASDRQKLRREVEKAKGQKPYVKPQGDKPRKLESPGDIKESDIIEIPSDEPGFPPNFYVKNILDPSLPPLRLQGDVSNKKEALEHVQYESEYTSNFQDYRSQMESAVELPKMKKRRGEVADEVMKAITERVKAGESVVISRGQYGMSSRSAKSTIINDPKLLEFIRSKNGAIEIKEGGQWVNHTVGEGLYALAGRVGIDGDKARDFVLEGGDPPSPRGSLKGKKQTTISGERENISAKNKPKRPDPDINWASGDDRIKYAQEGLERARKGNDPSAVREWQQELSRAQKVAFAQTNRRRQTKQTDIFGLLGQTEQEYDVTLPLFSQKRDSAAYLAGYHGLPFTTSPAFIAGYFDAFRRDGDSKADRDAIVTRAIETGYRSGIDRLVRYGLSKDGKKIIGYFMADGDAYHFQIADGAVSYKGISLRQDAIRRDRGPIPPKPRAKQKKRTCVKGLECGATCINSKKTCRIKLEQGLRNEVERLRAQLAEMEGKLAQAGEKQPAKPGDVRDEKLSDLNFDPKRFQYKLLPGETGATGSLTGVKKWDPNLAGVVQVWQDPADGKTYIVNGHNRATLANKLGVDEITVRYLKAKDAAEARAIGAITNIAEGRGNPLDAAKFFRDTGLSRQDLENKGIPMQERIANDGLAIAALDDSLFRRVVDGRLPMQRAATIGGSGLSHPQQRSLVEMIEKREKRGKVTNDTIRELADIVKASETQTEFTLDLFGGSESEKSLAIDRAELQSKIRQRLSRERRLFSTVGKSRSAQELERGGNMINVEQSANIAEETQQALRTFDRLKNMSGGISEEINAATRRMSEGGDKRKIQAELYNNILKRIQGGDY